MSRQENLWDTPNATSSPGSVDGVGPCASPGGQMTDPSGPEVVLANLSPRQAGDLGLLTSGTYGRHGSTSSPNVGPPLSSENKSPQPLSSESKRKARDRDYQMKYRRRHRAKDLIRHAKHRSDVKGIEFDLDQFVGHIQERIDQGTCEVTGFPFNLDSGRTWDSPSLDRINPKGGYLYSNIRVVCHGANSAMGDWGENMLIRLAMGIMNKRRQRSNELSLALGKRLQESLNGRGSPLFKLTWSERVTPSGHVFFRLAASGRRTSGKGCGSWPSPRMSDGDGGKGPMIGVSMTGRLPDGRKTTMALSPWATPATRDYRFANLKTYEERGGGKKGEQLNNQAVHLASWPTPKAHDGEFGTPMTSGRPIEKSTHLATITKLSGWRTPDSNKRGGDYSDPEKALARAEGGHQTNLSDQAILSGLPAPGSPAGTGSGGQLNPAFSLWLMGYPAEWDD